MATQQTLLPEILNPRLPEAVDQQDIDTALADSFPASDPPSWTPTQGTRPPARKSPAKETPGQATNNFCREMARFAPEEWHDIALVCNQEACAFAVLMAGILSVGIVLYLGIYLWVLSTI